MNLPAKTVIEDRATPADHAASPFKANIKRYRYTTQAEESRYLLAYKQSSAIYLTIFLYRIALPFFH